MMGDQVRLTVHIPAHPKGVGLVRGQSSVQNTPTVGPHQTGTSISLWTWCGVWRLCHFETGEERPQTMLNWLNNMSLITFLDLPISLSPLLYKPLHDLIVA